MATKMLLVRVASFNVNIVQNQTKHNKTVRTFMVSINTIRATLITDGTAKACAGTQWNSVRSDQTGMVKINLSGLELRTTTIHNFLINQLCLDIICLSWILLSVKVPITGAHMAEITVTISQQQFSWWGLPVQSSRTPGTSYLQPDSWPSLLLWWFADGQLWSDRSWVALY